MVILSWFVTMQDPKDIPVTGYSLVWQDEFNGISTSATKWNYRGLGKRDEAFISQDAVHLTGDGFLEMQVFQRNDSIFCAMIATENLQEFKYGYFECRAKFATTLGTVSAFWLQSKNIGRPGRNPEENGAEIDIFEFFPHQSRDHVYHTLHYGGYEPTTHKVVGPVAGKLDNIKDGFHTVGLEWTSEGYTTFVDGKKTSRLTTQVSKVPQFIVLSIGVNRNSAGPLDINALPDRFLVDYVRVYKKKNPEKERLDHP